MLYEDTGSRPPQTLQEGRERIATLNLALDGILERAIKGNLTRDHTEYVRVTLTNLAEEQDWKYSDVVDTLGLRLTMLHRNGTYKKLEIDAIDPGLRAFLRLDDLKLNDDA